LPRLPDVSAAHVDVRWLLAGVLLQIGSQAVRSRGWFNILRASYPQARLLRARDVMAASFAGTGFNGLVPARGGDLVKLAFVHRRIDGARYSTLVATAVPETAFESLCGAALVAWMLVRGLLPVPGVPGDLPQPDVVAGLVTLAALVVSFVVLRGLWRRGPRVVRRWRQGLAIFATPRRFVAQVAGWQALARVIRLGSLACFLAAFGLPATLATAVLVMAVQGGGRVVPLGPAGAGLRIAMLGYGLVAVAGQPVDPAAISAFTLGMSATLFVVMLVISAVLIGRELGTRSPRRAMQRARVRLQVPLVAVGDA
jgi:Lysylphosphatidylglycerol synthase TM region